MAATFTRLSTAFLFALAFCTSHAADAASAAGAAAATEAPVFGYSVICDDPAVAERLRSGIEARFAKLHVGLRERFPNAKLFIYANRDRNDTRNAEGISVAIAHVSNVRPAMLALGYIQRKETMPEALQAMLGEEGMLLHLNVAHMTTPSDAEMNQLLDQVVNSFVQKYTAMDGQAADSGRP